MPGMKTPLRETVNQRTATLLGAGRVTGSRIALAAPQTESNDGRPKLYVFLQTDVKSAALEKALQAKFPSLAVTVFGRFKDFEDAFLSKRPDVVLAVSPFLIAQKVAPTLQGVKGAKDWESYALVSNGAALDGPLSGRAVGIVDLLGRTGTQEFATSILKTPDLKLKRVTKVEDLLSLLQFSAADAVLMPISTVKAFTARSRLPLRFRELPETRVGLPGVAAINSRLKETVIKQFLALDADTNRVLGVEKWGVR